MRHLINKHYDTHGGFSAILANVSSHIKAPSVSIKEDETMKKIHLQVKNANRAASNYYGDASNLCGSPTVLAYPEDDFVKISENRKCKKCTNIYRVSNEGGE